MLKRIRQGTGMAQGDTVGWMRARVLCDDGRTTLRSVRQAGGGGGPEEHRDKAVRKGFARGQEGLFHSPAINETWVLPAPIDARRSGDASDRMALGRRRPARRGWDVPQGAASARRQRRPGPSCGGQALAPGAFPLHTQAGGVENGKQSTPRAGVGFTQTTVLRHLKQERFSRRPRPHRRHAWGGVA
ncbi:hypothetical protein Veis_0499 [Verminephrobacter eiseniae EF01-2]|uniref:Uncharacterized protein n=1 Tax=Verminephrobacter eiseniae (strain EF01-2) TaxID=391735 RepID=A1WF76_VEREI|nr:hypothetical protein Veis_0499 [Verminephrobacter eiseniae EF01-2]